MALPKELQQFKGGGKITNAGIGFTGITIDYEKHAVTIEHRGNMGARIKDVEEDVDLCLGKGIFKRLEKICESMTEDGYPDYYYKRIMKF